MRGGSKLKHGKGVLPRGVKWRAGVLLCLALIIAALGALYQLSPFLQCPYDQPRRFVIEDKTIEGLLRTKVLLNTYTGKH